MPTPLGFGSALIDLFKDAEKDFFKFEDILNEIVSFGRNESLSEYPTKGIVVIY